MTIVVGLTGGIASGKSFISKHIKKRKIPIHDSDVFVKDLYKNPKKDFLSFLKKNGFNNLVVEKKILKEKIRDEVFLSDKKRKKLEYFIHNKIKKNRDIFLKKNKNKKIVFLDIPLLFEKKLEKNCDFICCAISSLKIRKARAIQRPGMSKKLLNLILKTQTKDVLRKKKSDFLINTSKSKSNTCLQIDNIIYYIQKKDLSK